MSRTSSTKKPRAARFRGKLMEIIVSPELAGALEKYLELRRSYDPDRRVSRNEVVNELLRLGLEARSAI